MGQSRKGAEYLSEGIINFLCTPDQQPSCVCIRKPLCIEPGLCRFSREPRRQKPKSAFAPALDPLSRRDARGSGTIEGAKKPGASPWRGDMRTRPAPIWEIVAHTTTPVHTANE